MRGGQSKVDALLERGLEVAGAPRHVCVGCSGLWGPLPWDRHTEESQQQDVPSRAPVPSPPGPVLTPRPWGATSWRR